jgi:hypothetical protein
MDGGVTQENVVLQEGARRNVWPSGDGEPARDADPRMPRMLINDSHKRVLAP